MRANVWSVLILSCLFLMSTAGANPGGVGLSSQDMQCGGACHGDADLNATSPYTIEIEHTSTAYAGLPTSIRLSIGNLDALESDIIGIFLLTDTTGFEDTPEDDGWTVISNSQGGDGNYAEIQKSGEFIHIDWTLLAPNTPGSQTFYGSVHHGSTGSSDIPYFGISSTPLTVQVVPVPENLPRIDPDADLPTQRQNGEVTEIILKTVEVENMTLEWRVQGGDLHSSTINSSNDQQWTFTIPATLTPDIVEWRVILSGNDIEQTSPWFQLSSLTDLSKVDNTAMYVQSFALLIFTAGLYLGLSRVSREGEGQTKQFDAIDDVLGQAGGEHK